MFYWDPVSRIGFFLYFLNFWFWLIFAQWASTALLVFRFKISQCKTWHLVLLSVNRFIQFRAAAKDYSDCWEICWLFSQLIDDYFIFCLLPFIQFTIMQDKDKQKILTSFLLENDSNNELIIKTLVVFLSINSFIPIIAAYGPHFLPLVVASFSSTIIFCWLPPQ